MTVYYLKYAILSIFFSTWVLQTQVGISDGMVSLFEAASHASHERVGSGSTKPGWRSQRPSSAAEKRGLQLRTWMPVENECSDRLIMPTFIWYTLQVSTYKQGSSSPSSHQRIFLQNPFTLSGSDAFP
ncbi:MAG: hypothetical protein ABIK68_21755, partial [bacterium]